MSAKAPAVTAMVTATRPAPRMSSDAASSHSLVAVLARAKARVLAAVRARPVRTTGRGPVRSVSWPAMRRGTREPMSWTARSSPAISGLLPWTSW